MGTQRSFTRQIKGLEGLDYAERLKKLKKPMYSIQRRYERFKIIYVYKIKEKLVPNISYRNGLTFSMHIRHGCRCIMPTFPMRGRANERSLAFFALPLMGKVGIIHLQPCLICILKDKPFLYDMFGTSFSFILYTYIILNLSYRLCMLYIGFLSFFRRSA